MYLQANESFATERLVLMAEDYPRLPFLEALRATVFEPCDKKRARAVETVVRTSRILSDDPGLMPEEVQANIMKLIAHFRAFGPSVVEVPKTYAEARSLIKDFFF